METITNILFRNTSYQFFIAIAIFIFILFCQYKWSCSKCQLESFQNRVMSKTPKYFHTIISNLLDNKNLSDKIVLELDINDMETLLNYNYNYKQLNKEPLLNNYQEKLVKSFILYRDYYFINKKQSDIVPLVRKNIDENILTTLNESDKMLSINLFRRNIFYFYEHYFSKEDFSLKTKWMQNNIGLKKINKFTEGLNTYFQNQNWFGLKYINNTSTLPIGIVIFHPESDTFYHRQSGNLWVKFKLKLNNATLNKSVDLKTLKSLDEITSIDKYRKLYKHLHLWYDTDTIKLYSEDWYNITQTINKNKIPTSTFYHQFENIKSKTVPVSQYIFFDYPLNDSLESLTKSLLKAGIEDKRVLGNDIEVKNIKFWIKNLEITDAEKKYFIKNLLTSYYYANFETFVDLLTILAYYDINKVSDIVDLFPDPSKKYFNNYWTYKDWDLIQKNSLKMGQCNALAQFKITKVSANNWKFNYNGTDYYNYWSAIETYVNDLINSITLGLKNTDPNIISSVAEFCYINNKSFTQYLYEGSKCEEDTCNDIDISKLYEPNRCQNLKNKYRDLHIKISKKECADLKNNGKSDPVTKDLMMLNIMKLALKIRNCQNDFTLPEQKCIDNEIEWKLDTEDKPGDKDLSQIESNRKFVLDDSANQLFTAYDRQLESYRKLMAKQEKIELYKLNELANHAETTNKTNIEDMTLSQLGQYVSKGILNMVDDISTDNNTETPHSYSKNNMGITNSNDPTLATPHLKMKSNNIQTDDTGTMWQQFSGLSGMPVSNDLIEGFVVIDDENKINDTKSKINDNVKSIDSQGEELWEPKNDKQLQKLYDKTNNKKKINIINQDTRNTTNTNAGTIHYNKNDKEAKNIDDDEFKRIEQSLKTQSNKTNSKSIKGKLSQLLMYLRLFINIATQKDKLMFSGTIFIIIAFSLYFIDITS